MQYVKFVGVILVVLVGYVVALGVKRTNAGMRLWHHCRRRYGDLVRAGVSGRDALITISREQSPQLSDKVYEQVADKCQDVWRLAVFLGTVFENPRPKTWRRTGPLVDEEAEALIEASCFLGTRGRLTTDYRVATQRLIEKGFDGDKQHPTLAKKYYDTGNYQESLVQAGKALALLRRFSCDAEQSARRGDELVEMVRLRVNSLRRLGRDQEALVECDRGIGYFNEFVERIHELRESAGGPDEQALDKLEELAICRALDLSQVFAAVKRETGAELPHDYDPGFRIEVNK